ncbi:hypothetical protein [Bifidobacterium simiarum]|uniref:hypothetical protein n=1 Tax=Bifidobacterium simiarum TaxID=2045441 RepID=UPI0013FDA7D1|nr:hypothetical protein [Bifidobacterium simiarum]
MGIYIFGAQFFIDSSQRLQFIIPRRNDPPPTMEASSTHIHQQASTLMPERGTNR